MTIKLTRILTLYVLVWVASSQQPVVQQNQQQQVPIQQQQQQQVPVQQQQQVPVQQQQQVPVQQQQFQQPPVQNQQQPVVQQQQQQPPPVQQQQQFQQPPPPVQQQQFQQPPPPVQQQQQFQQPPPPVQQQQQFQQPPPPVQQQQQFQQPASPPVPQQQQQQQQFQPPPVQQQPPQQQQQFQPPPVQQQVPPVPDKLKPPPPPQKPVHNLQQPKKIEIRHEQRGPKLAASTLDSVRMPSAQRFKGDLDPSRSYVYLMVHTQNGVRDCYFYNPIYDIRIFYQVISGGQNDVGFAVVDPEGRVIIQKEATKESEIKVTVPPEFRDQAYALCVDNRKASAGEKVVYLSVDLDLNYSNPSDEEKQIIDAMRDYGKDDDDHSNLSDEQRQKIELDIESLGQALDSIASRMRKINLMQSKTRNINTIDRITLQRNFQRVQSWSLFQVTLMIVVAIIQTTIIRSLFEGGKLSIWGVFFNKKSNNKSAPLNARA